MMNSDNIDMIDMLQLMSEYTNRWFTEKYGLPTETQRQAWQAIAAGGDALVVAPTGTGKTLAAFMYGIDQLTRQSLAGELADELSILYITPLKALGNDIVQNLEQPLAGVRRLIEADGFAETAPIRTTIRHGDTTSTDRARMLRKPPHILITTPESLFLLLTGDKSRRMLSTVKTVIVDEIHSILTNKRGASLSVSLERLALLCQKPPQRVGLSATVALPESCAAFLTGADISGAARPCKIVIPKISKQTDIKVDCAVKDEQKNSVWPSVIKNVYDIASVNKETLAFVNGRMTAERLASGLNALHINDITAGDLEAGGSGVDEPFARSHHGSMSKDMRIISEGMFKRGELKCLCATGTMELGIDVGFVDAVVQIGAIPTIASGLQRLGRAGHAPGLVSRMYVFGKLPNETLDASISARLMQDATLERLISPDLCLDVLAQQCLSMVWRESAVIDEMLLILRGAWGMRCLTREMLESVILMLSGHYERISNIQFHPRLYYDSRSARVSGDKYTRMLALAASTIPDRGLFPVFLENSGTRLGELDEEFVFEARLGDRFMLGAFAWQIDRIERDRVIVRQSTRAGAQVPFWRGEGFGRAYEIGVKFGEILSELERADNVGAISRMLPVTDQAADVILRLIGEQKRAVGGIATDKRIVVETFLSEAGYDCMMIHSQFGGMVHTGLAILLRRAIERETCSELLVYHSDQGLLISCAGDARLPTDIVKLITDELRIYESTDMTSAADMRRAVKNAIAALLPPTPLFGLVFRHAAARAMMFGAKNGRRQPLWVQRERGAKLLDFALSQPGHPMVEETLRECLTEHIDVAGLSEVIVKLAAREIEVLTVRSAKPSPMTSDLLNQMAGDEMYDYSPTPGRAKRTSLAAGSAASFAIDALSELRPPSEESLSHARKRTRLSGPDALAAWLLSGGDALTEEIIAQTERAKQSGAQSDVQPGTDDDTDISCACWLEDLLAQGRIQYTEQGLWIASEHADIYARLSELDVFRDIIIRRLKFRGSHTLMQLAGVYSVDTDALSDILESMAADGKVVLFNEMYVHPDVYVAASLQTVASLRRDIRTAEPRAYAAFLAGRMLNAVGADKLSYVLTKLLDYPLPLSAWENEILPARIPNYRPYMLDKIIASGEITYQLSPGENDEPMLSFRYPNEMDAEAAVPESELSETERMVCDILKKRGASFTANIKVGNTAQETLLGLLKRGIVLNDSFAPVRALAADNKRLRIKYMSQAGRWSCAHLGGITDINLETRLDNAFMRWGIVSKETLVKEGIRFAEALSILRVWEYRGKIRRGLFVGGMSGVQFVLDVEYATITSALMNIRSDVYCLNARDIAQAWGNILPHRTDRAYSLLAGTFLVIRAGEVILISRRHGASLQWFDEDGAKVGLAELHRAFKQERVEKGKPRFVVEEYPEGGASLLEEAGWQKDGNSYSLWRV